MARLTRVDEDGTVLCIGCAEEKECNGDCLSCQHDIDAIEKLAEYENAEEQGLLYRKIFFIGNYCHKPSDCPLICEYCSDNYLEVKDSVVEINRIYIYGEIGKTVFLTKEEAKQALERMGVENG